MNQFKSTNGGISLSNLVEPFVIAHRGGANLYPENTMVAFRNIVAAGNYNLEFDVQTLADGSLGIMHNSTVDGTTTGSGNVNTFDTYAFSKLIVDSSVWLVGSADTTVPLFEDVLREFGRNVLYFPESKDAVSAEKIAQCLVRYGLQNNAVIQSSSATDLASVIPYGIKTMLLSDTYDMAIAQSYGFNYVGVSMIATDEYLASIISHGLKPVVFTIDLRSDWEIFKAKGCVACFSNDPIWISGTRLTPKKADLFNRKTFYHGHISNGGLSSVYNGGLSRGIFYGVNRWGFDTTAISYVLQGWGSPIANASSTYSIQFTLTVEAYNADTTRWGSLAFGSPLDFFNDTGSSRSNAYQVLMRESGLVSLYKIVNGSATLLGSQATTALALNGTATIKVDVTPTSITVTRTDVAAPNTVTSADTTLRGGYFFLNHQGLVASYSDVTITP